MVFWKTRTGEELTFKQFMVRWKQGFEKVTPLQQLQMVYLGTWIIVIGIICGLIYSIINKSWWLSAILVGALIVQLFGLLGNCQKINKIKQIEMQFASPSFPAERTYIQ